MDDSPKTHLAHAGAAWGAVGISKYLSVLGINSWSDVAALLASVYTLVLLVDYAVKKVRKARAKKDEHDSTAPSTY